MVALVGLILNYTPWGIRLYPILIGLTIFILGASIIARVRRRGLVEDERLTISFSFRLHSWRGQSRLDKILSVILIVAILGAAGTTGYVIATPKQAERFTEFYVLGPEGKVGGYPEELTAGETATVIAGIVNYEHEEVSYQIEVVIDGATNNEVTDIVLGPEQKWEREVLFTPASSEVEHKVEFVLYKNGEPYSRLHLWVNVTGYLR